MAVKHKVVDYEDRPVSGSYDCMSVMLRVLEKLRNEPQTMPQGQDLVRLCESIVRGLGMLVVPCEPSAIASFVQDVRSIQDFLSTVCMTGQYREQLVFATLKTLYTDISDPKNKPGAAMSVVLQLVNTNYLPSAVNLILDAGHTDSSLERALMTLCGWMTCWTKTPNLGECVLVFIQGLESQKRFDILINVTLSFVEKFFSLLMLPCYRTAVGPIVIYMLTHMQGSPEAFHKIIPLVPDMVNRLKQENTENGRTYMQEIVDVCKALTEHFHTYDSLYDILDMPFKMVPTSPNYLTCLRCTPWSETFDLLVVQRSKNTKVGLHNLGNTCYMNSVLQALFMTKLFSNDVLIQENRWPLITKLQALFALLQFSQRSSLSPSDILHMARPPGFLPGHQHDSSEFLGYLLDILHEQEKSCLAARKETKVVSAETDSKQHQSTEATGAGEPPPPTVVQRAFGGRAETIYKCHACGAESIRADNFRELQLSFPGDFTEGESVQTLLDYYLKPERLCDDNQYHCERCNGLSDAERLFRVIQPPPRLVLTLKHFHYNSASQQRIKLLHRVQYNATLTLANATYELYAAVIHCGTSVDSGHYYTYARDTQGWYKFNDSCVSSCSASDLSNLCPPETPYILFYSRQDCLEPETIGRTELPATIDTVLRREIAELEAEQRNRQRIETNKQRFTKKDDPPPPGCGGGGSIMSADRFVC